jgi:cysteinyl-tRNA synthetase
MHNGFLQVEGEKMSKSLGNFVTSNEQLKTLDGNGLVVRYNMLRTHYRQPIDWTQNSIAQASNELNDLLLVAWDYEGLEPDTKFIEALCDDLNTPLARARLFELKEAARRNNDQAGDALRASLELYGFGALFSKPTLNLPPFFISDDAGDQLQTLVLDHNGHMTIGQLRELLKANDEGAVGGVKCATTFWDLLSAIEPKHRLREIGHITGAQYRSFAVQINNRNAARKARNFKEADRIRDELTAIGIQLKDSKDPATGDIVTTWEVKR